MKSSGRTYQQMFKVAAMGKTKKIAWWVPAIGSREYDYVKKVLKNDFPNEGPFTELFEKKIGGLTHSRYCTATTSGTAAIFLALKALEIGPGDEVIVPDVTFIATANAVTLTGARAVLVDVEPDDLCLSPRALKAAITNRTKAVIPVSVSGRGGRLDEIVRIAAQRKIDVVEDASEGFMSKYQGRYLGTLGRLGCLSFSAHKIITTGQGGAVLTQERRLHQKLKELKDQGRPVRGTGGDDFHKSLGYNFKFTDIQAAVGLGQLNSLKERMRNLLKNHQYYTKRLSALAPLTLFPFDLTGGELPLWTDAAAQDREGLKQYLLAHNIHCRNFWFPLHRQRPYRQSDDKFPNSTRMSSQSFWLPSAFTLQDADREKVCRHIQKYFQSEKRFCKNF